MPTDLKVYDKIRALAGSYKMMHNDVEWSCVLRNEDVLRGTIGVDTYESMYFTIESLEDNNTITFSKAYYAPENTFAYSTDDGATWTSVTLVQDTSYAKTMSWSLNSNEKLLIKAIAESWCGSEFAWNYCWQFSSSKTYNVYGNIMSMFYGDDFLNKHSFPTQTSSLYSFFRSSYYLVNASKLKLPVTTLTERCYDMMFQGCTSLTAIPDILPATTLASSCYEGMFNNCTSLVNASNLKIMASTLAEWCCSTMFGLCTSLIYAPELPATTLAEHCYNEMFEECRSLVNGPSVLPATTLAEGCYAYMFNTCENLSYIKCLATDISAENCLDNWLRYVAASGTFVKAASMSSWPTGDSGIPANWTVVDAA